MGTLLCPMKKETKTVTMKSQVINVNDADFTSVISFGNCSKESCAWWDKSEDQCATLSVGNAIHDLRLDLTR